MVRKATIVLSAFWRAKYQWQKVFSF